MCHLGRRLSNAPGRLVRDEYQTRTWTGWHCHNGLGLRGWACLQSLQQAWREGILPVTGDGCHDHADTCITYEHGGPVLRIQHTGWLRMAPVSRRMSSRQGTTPGLPQRRWVRHSGYS